ncbi:MAG: hypothetical protein OEZ37_07150, partial [Gemmatimonadota bacterium]|nr:hypothetical protein [Gemmatimonadota bacterium]
METSNETFSAPIPVAAAGEKGAGLRWLWVVGGVALGTVLITSLVAVVRNEPPRPDVAIVVGALTFALTGILAGYHSPGNTMAEAGVAGGILGILTMVSIHLLYGLGIPPLLVALG